MKTNKDIREKIENGKIKYWQVAYKLGIDDTAFSKKLRKELSDKEKEKINKIIDNLIKEKQENE